MADNYKEIELTHNLKQFEDITLSKQQSDDFKSTASRLESSGENTNPDSTIISNTGNTNENENPGEEEEEKPQSKLLTFIFNFLRVLAIIPLLYIFVCSLELLSDAFRLIAGKAAGMLLANTLSKNCLHHK